MVRERTVRARFSCVLGGALLVLASCGGNSTESASAIAEGPTTTPETIPTVEIEDILPGSETDDPTDTDPLTPTEDSETPNDPADSSKEIFDGGVVPEPNGNEPTEPEKDAAPDSTQTSETTEDPSETPALPVEPIPGGGNASAIERRIADLTNQLRTNPNGPLKRTGNVPTCDGGVEIDPATGQPVPVPALSFDDSVSVSMARSWSAQMSANNFQHRPNQQALLQSLSISPQAWGENIAFHAPPKDDPAMFHFTQWRQSDGHFCNMMSRNFSSIGVGEHQHDGGSFATQNFFA